MRSEDSDRLVDEALAKYASEEPRPGLEQRVLFGVRAARERRRVGLWRWAVAIAAAACMLAAGIVWMRRQVTPVIVPVPVARVPAAPAVPVVKTATTRHKRRAAPRLVKQPVFPLPAPVTRQEQALMAFASQAPEVARNTFNDDAEAGIALLQFEEIKIQPLDSDGLP